MTVRSFLAGSFISLLASAGILFLIISWIDPTKSPALGFILFFLTLFLAVASLASLVGYIARVVVMRHQLPAYRVRPSLRQGVFLGVFVDLLLFLQLERILVWWVSGIIVLLFVVIELVFVSYDKNSPVHRGTPAES